MNHSYCSVQFWITASQHQLYSFFLVCSDSALWPLSSTLCPTVLYQFAC